jgi:long-chain acyl-CoA synthetase
MEYQFNDSGVTAIVICSNFASQLEKILQNTSIKLVVTTELFDLHPQPKRFLMNAAIKYLKKMVPNFKLPNAISFRKALEVGKNKSFSPVVIQSSDLAFLQYTGGTTGVSKGAMLTHRNIVANMEQVCAWMQIGLIEKEEVCIMPLPMYHVFSLTVNALSFFKFGTQNILVTNPRDISALIKLLKNSKFSIMTGVNTLYNAMLNHADFKGINFTNLKLCVAGAMALQKSVAEKWLKETKTPIVEGYGLTETSPVVCCNAPTGEYRLGTIGLPVPSTEVKILKEDGSEAKIDEPGMLCVKGPQVMKGYWEKEDETKNVFTSDGWLKTGDIASISKDGFFTIQDREKDMIIVSGFKVFPNEVEAVLATHPKILEAGVIGVEDPHSGEVVKAFIVKKAEDLTEKDVIEHCKKNLTNYKIPKYITFVPSLPKTNVGKVLRKDLRKAA